MKADNTKNGDGRNGDFEWWILWHLLCRDTRTSWLTSKQNSLHYISFYLTLPVVISGIWDFGRSIDLEVLGCAPQIDGMFSVLSKYGSECSGWWLRSKWSHYTVITGELMTGFTDRCTHALIHKHTHFYTDTQRVKCTSNQADRWTDWLADRFTLVASNTHTALWMKSLSWCSGFLLLTVGCGQWKLILRRPVVTASPLWLHYCPAKSHLKKQRYKLKLEMKMKMKRWKNDHTWKRYHRRGVKMKRVLQAVSQVNQSMYD